MLSCLGQTTMQESNCSCSSIDYCDWCLRMMSARDTGDNPEQAEGGDSDGAA